LRSYVEAAMSRAGEPEVMARELADLVDGVLVQVHAQVLASFILRHGRARRRNHGRCQHAVLALGSYGRRELDPRLAVQLLFVYATDDGGSDGAHGLSPGLDLHTYHARLFSELTRALSVGLQVDLDHRPEGRSGPICNSAEALESYYESFGHALDRKHLASARVVAGDLEFGAEVLASLSPFVFRRSIDTALSADLRVESLVAGSGAGGEAIVVQPDQVRAALHDLLDTLCLGFGGRFPTLREGDTRDRLAALVRHRLLADDDADRLRALHRALLHHAFAMADTGASMGAVDPALVTVLIELIASLPTAARSDEPGIDLDLDLALDPDTAPARRHAALATLGFNRPELAASRLDVLARHPESPFHRRHASARPSLAKVLLQAASRSTDADQALTGIETLVHQLRHQTHAATQLAHDARRVDRLVALFAAEPVATRHLLGTPALLSHIVLEGEQARSRTREGLLQQLQDELALGHDPLAVARRFHVAELTRIAYEDTANVAKERAILAEAVIIGLACAIGRVDHAEALPFVILVRGPLAKGALAPGEALDLGLVVRDADAQAHARLARRLITALTAPTSEGALFLLAPTMIGQARARVVALPRLVVWLDSEASASEREAALAFRVLGGPADLSRALMGLQVAAPFAGVSP
jgi:glutamate-ammonia-ligase adenylyltransferase